MISTGSLSEAVQERWRTAGRFAHVLEAEVKARTQPYGVLVVSWFNLCRLCQDLEEQMLLEDRPEDRTLHRVLLSMAIASGESLLLEPEQPEALRPLRLTMAGLRAKLESLRITFEQWHTELKPERQAAVLREVFGVQR